MAETEEMLESLLLSFSSATDTLGVPLLKEEMTSIWEEQKRHIKCLQDPPGVSLYTVTGEIKKGGVSLKTVRCARGSTSLESFHSHITRFIPGTENHITMSYHFDSSMFFLGTSSSAINFQAYLLDGIVRWNESRSRASVAQQHQTLRTFDHEMQSRLNALSQAVHGVDLFPLYRPPAQYTGELLGVQYLYHQTGRMLLTEGEEMEKEIDEGFGDIEDYTQESLEPECQLDEDLQTFSLLAEEDEDDRDEQVILKLLYYTCIHSILS